MIAATLPTCLAACSSATTGPAKPVILPPASAAPASRKVEIRERIVRICPTPTDAAKREKIIAELQATIKAGVPPNTLATEWERGDDYARKCRGA